MNLSGTSKLEGQHTCLFTDCLPAIFASLLVHQLAGGNMIAVLPGIPVVVDANLNGAIKQGGGGDIWMFTGSPCPLFTATLDAHLWL